MRSYLFAKRDALLASSALFWLPSGYSADDVLAAFQFKGVSSEAESLRDLTGHGYNLTKTAQSYNGSHSPSWSSDDGFTYEAVYQGLSGYLDNSTLDNQAIACAVIRFSDLTNNDRGFLITAGGSSGLAQLNPKTAIWEDSQVKTYSGASYPLYTGAWGTSGTAITGGVLGANFGVNNKLFINGERKNVTTRTADTELSAGGGKQGKTLGNSHAQKSNLNNAVHCGKKIQAVVFFKVALTDDQHLEVAQRMADL